jgi:hypothetical protein
MTYRFRTIGRTVLVRIDTAAFATRVQAGDRSACRREPSSPFAVWPRGGARARWV